MITSIRLQNFRSYGNSPFEFEPGVNIIIGPNASGKTNLLEAILVLCRGSSYRVRDVELIRFNKDWARLDGIFDKHDRSLKLEKRDSSIQKTYVIDDKEYSRLPRDKTEKVVLFEPNHLQLIQRGPEARRDYLDELLEASEASYAQNIRAYRRVLAQRNSLLKQSRKAGRDQLFAWDVRLSQLGEKIVSARAGLSDAINKEISITYSHIAGKKSMVITAYSTQFEPTNYGSRLLAKLQATIETDYERGFTGHGPHRDDLNFSVNGQAAAISASRGEARSLMLALKVFELGLIEGVTGQPAILLLDDVFSELDGRRRHALVDFLKDHQTMITTTDADTVLDFFAGGEHRLISI